MGKLGITGKTQIKGSHQICAHMIVHKVIALLFRRILLCDSLQEIKDNWLKANDTKTTKKPTNSNVVIHN